MSHTYDYINTDNNNILLETSFAHSRFSMDEKTQIIKAAKYYIKKYSLKPIKELGTGDNGLALLMENNNVLKITTSLDEFNVAKIIHKSKFKHIVKIYNIDQYENLYLIEEEYLELNKNNQKLYENFFSILPHLIQSAFAQTNHNLERNNIIKYIDYNRGNNVDYIFTNVSRNKNIMNFIYEVLKNKNDWYTQTFVIFIEIINEIKKIDNATLDLHSGNIGFDKKGNLKAFDIT